MTMNARPKGTGSWRTGVATSLVLIGIAWPAVGLPHPSGTDGRLSKIGPAPEFVLTDQNGRRFALSEIRGKVAVVTFIYASCADTCPLLTAKMAALQERLGSDFGSRVFFVSITVDPERDTAEVLRRYAPDRSPLRRERRDDRSCGARAKT